MHAAQDSISFAPPEPPGMLRAVGLALLAHALLLLALVWNVHWKQTEVATVEAELWSNTVQQAAPKAVEEAPAPPPPPTPAPEPAPPPVAKVMPPPAPDLHEAEIALERAKKKREAEKQAQAEQDRQEKTLREKAKLEKDKQDALKAQKEQKAQEAADKKRAEEKQAEDKRIKDKKAAQEKQAKEAQEAQKDEAQKAKAQADAKAAAAQRAENLKRIAGMAGATGAANATGTAQRSTAPSAGYGGKVAAKVKSNIVFPDGVDNNPVAEIEVRSSSDGHILSSRLTKSSGNKNWDDAVLKAIDKTETMPRDTDGTVPPTMILTLRPKD